MSSGGNNALGDDTDSRAVDMMLQQSEFDKSSGVFQSKPLQ